MILNHVFRNGNNIYHVKKIISYRHDAIFLTFKIIAGQKTVKINVYKAVISHYAIALPQACKTLEKYKSPLAL